MGPRNKFSAKPLLSPPQVLSKPFPKAVARSSEDPTVRHCYTGFIFTNTTPPQAVCLRLKQLALLHVLSPLAHHLA